MILNRIRLVDHFPDRLWSDAIPVQAVLRTRVSKCALLRMGNFLGNKVIFYNDWGQVLSCSLHTFNVKNFFKKSKIKKFEKFEKNKIGTKMSSIDLEINF